MVNITVTFEETPEINDQTDTKLIEQISSATPSGCGAELRFDPKYWDIEGTLATALELLFSAPAFDGINTDAVEAALGSGIHAVVLPTPESTGIVATNQSFDATEEITRENCPASAGDTLPVDGQIAEFVDWPTDGPAFEFSTGDGGLRGQIEASEAPSKFTLE
mgnify:CR=1 FL=1